MHKSFVSRIDKQGLCLGCGFCQAIGTSGNIFMRLGEDGFYHPEVINNNVDKIIEKVCPSHNVLVKEKCFGKSRLWGSILKLYSGFSVDAGIRSKATSGGVISQIAIELLEDKKSGVDAILHVVGDKNDYKKNKLKISRTREELLNKSSSRYAPAIVFADIINILNSSKENYAFIGKPCDITGLDNFLNQFREYDNRFKYKISIVCAGIPSFNATEELISSFSPRFPVNNLEYRGLGWPGNFVFSDANGEQFERSYAESWGQVLGKHIHLRCKLCPDGIGLVADIAVGDAWETRDGYPDFEEREGRSLIFVRSPKALSLVTELERRNRLHLDSVEERRLKSIQPFQYHRRRVVGIRLIAFFITRFHFFNYRGLNLIGNTTSLSLKMIIRESIGSIKRFLR